MEHHHGHNHNALPAHIGRAFTIGILLNLAFVSIEFIVGLSLGSLSLLTDAGHNLSDVGSLALSLAAFRLSALKPRKQYTYGFKKTTILASLFNAILLLVVVGAILVEAIGRFRHPVHIPGMQVAIVAFAGIIINGISALLFFRDKDKDLNIKGAYLHLFADALVSVGVVIGGIIIYYTDVQWIDPLLSMIIAGVILFSTYGLLKDSIRMSLDGIPKNIEMDKVQSAAMSIRGVVAFQHIHIWAMSTTENALTGHLIVQYNLNETEIDSIKCNLKHKLEHLNIVHSTLETDREYATRRDQGCEHSL